MRIAQIVPACASGQNRFGVVPGGRLCRRPAGQIACDHRLELLQVVRDLVVDVCAVILGDRGWGRWHRGHGLRKACESLRDDCARSARQGFVLQNVPHTEGAADLFLRVQMREFLAQLSGRREPEEAQDLVADAPMPRPLPVVAKTGRRRRYLVVAGAARNRRRRPPRIPTGTPIELVIGATEKRDIVPI